MKRLLAALAALLLSAMPVKAAASVSINEPGPYHVGQYITLTVDPGKLKGYEYPVVNIWCGTRDDGEGGTIPNYVYFRRWDVVKGLEYQTGPEPILLTEAMTVAPCTVELWAYAGLKGPGATEHVIAVGPTFTVS